MAAITSRTGCLLKIEQYSYFGKHYDPNRGRSKLMSRESNPDIIHARSREIQPELAHFANKKA